MYQNAAERALYQRAASDFRIPYWDWAKDAPPGQTHFPDMFWDQVITQDGPRGRQWIRNPLYSYQFHPVNEEDFIWAPVSSPETIPILDADCDSSNIGRKRNEPPT